MHNVKFCSYMLKYMWMLMRICDICMLKRMGIAKIVPCTCLWVLHLLIAFKKGKCFMFWLKILVRRNIKICFNHTCCISNNNYSFLWIYTVEDLFWTLFMFVWNQAYDNVKYMGINFWTYSLILLNLLSVTALSFGIRAMWPNI